MDTADTKKEAMKFDAMQNARHNEQMSRSAVSRKRSDQKRKGDS